MKKFILIAVCLMMGLTVRASETQDVLAFFNRYVNSANNYKADFFDFYAPNASIVRVVVKPDGSKQSVQVPFDVYKRQSKMSARFGKIKKYKNDYSNINVEKIGSDYKIDALRRPSTSDYKLPASFVVTKDSQGQWKIKNESMETKVQGFLRRSN